jgi:DNA-binding transcriptional ArsR family regulator
MGVDDSDVGELSSLRVLAHPLRLRMLSLLTGAEFSAIELSRELGISQALASYHLRQLHAAGVVELAQVRHRRGGQERRFTYRPAASPGATPAPADSHALFAEAICVELRRRSREAQPGGRRLGVDAELWVEPAVWDATVEAMRAASVGLHEGARPPRTPGTVRVSVSALLFPMADPSSSAGVDDPH